MTDKVQRIREEVERIKTVHSSVSLKDSKPDMLVVQICINLLSFIDSLQEEPQVKEPAEIQHNNETCQERDNSLTPEPASEDLEGEVAAFLNQYNYPREEVDFSSFARHIAQWQKQQMMKEALEAEVVSGAVRKELMTEVTKHLEQTVCFDAMQSW